MARKRKRKIKGTYCEERLAPKTAFDPRSFRYKRSGKAWLIVGCPKGQWDPRAQLCKVGTRAHKLLTPAKGKRCPVGAKRIQK
jgi:hypothetical protein